MGMGKNRPLTGLPGRFCHAGGRGFESRRSRPAGTRIVARVSGETGMPPAGGFSFWVPRLGTKCRVNCTHISLTPGPLGLAATLLFDGSSSMA
jgi:hypothetical protein